MSKLEETFAFHLLANKIEGFERELKFHPTRKWRFDFADQARMIAIEVEGGTFVSGRHNRGRAMAGDMEKYNEATRLGWRVYRFDTNMVNDGRAVNYIADLLANLEMAA